TARVYDDLSLITADEKIGLEVAKVFQLLESESPNLNKRFSQLLVSPINTRKRFIDLIKNEIAVAKQGRTAEIYIKLNNLTDVEMIEWLYKASKAGVVVKMIIRGICCLVPGVEGLSENITVYSI